MKIGVITHHYVKNYGAYLQARGLTEILKKVYPDASVEIVNYVNRKHWIKNIIHILHYRNGADNLKTYSNKIRQLIMFSHYEHSLRISSPVKSAQEIKNLQYDLLVFGSDEIWDRQGRGFRPLKYGVGMRNAAKRMIAYAPSVGKVSGEEPLPLELKEGLKNFDAISARDVQTQIMVAQIGVEAPLVLDPTLLYDFDCDLKEENTHNLPFKYILIYDCKLKEDQVESLTRYAQDNHLEIVGGGDYKPYYTKEYICLTPYEWVNLFKNAELVITGTFHGTVFSVKYKKNFISFPTEKNRIQKISSLLNVFGLTCRLLDGEDANLLVRMINTKVDYSNTETVMKKMYEKSIHFLEGTL